MKVLTISIDLFAILNQDSGFMLGKVAQNTNFYLLC